MNKTNNTILGNSLFDKGQKTKEKDLVLPVLLTLAQADRINHGEVSTYQLYTMFNHLAQLSENDKQELTSDKRPRFKRTVQNIFSHDLLKDYVERKNDGWIITAKGRGFLTDMLMPDDVQGDDNKLSSNPKPSIDSNESLEETMVAFQMLVCMSESQKGDNVEKIKPMTTSQFRNKVKATLPLSVSDLKVMQNSKYTKIDRTVQNVISHNTLTKNGWATRSEKGFTITNKGKARVLDYLLDEFPSPDFGFLMNKEKEFRNQLKERRAEVARQLNEKKRTKQGKLNQRKSSKVSM